MAEGKLKILLLQSLTALPWESSLSERKVVHSDFDCESTENFGQSQIFCNLHRYNPFKVFGFLRREIYDCA